MRTNKTILYLGLNDKDTKTQKIDILEAYKITQNIILRYTGGATIFSADGIYTHEDGTVVIEKTLRIELFDVAPDRVAAVVDDLKKAFNQESIIVSQEVTETVFM